MSTHSKVGQIMPVKLTEDEFLSMTYRQRQQFRQRQDVAMKLHNLSPVTKVNPLTDDDVVINTEYSNNGKEEIEIN
jgi:hypothetical protein